MFLYQHHYRIVSRFIVVMILAAIALLTLSRGVMLVLIADPDIVFNFVDGIGRAFFIGGRFDLKIATIAFAPLLLLGLVMSANLKLFTLWQRISLGYSGLIFFLLSAFSIGNYFYYTTYGSHFDVFIFGIFDDDTKAILDDAWVNYPIIRSFLLSLLIASIAAWGSKRLLMSLSLKQWPNRRTWVFVVSVIAFVVVYVIAARGSIGSLPLKRYHANVSQYKPLNIVTPNAFMALDWAKSDYKKQTTFKAIDPELVTQQMVKVLGQATPEYQTPSNKYLAENKPHIVVTLMEGLGQNVLIEDDPQSNDLLGALRPHFKNDFLFERFAAGTSATIDSIVMMLFHSDIPTISHSNAQRVELPSSAVLPYKEAGYEVIFLYSGNSMWRNLANYLPRQGFDKVLDENDIKSEFPNAEEEETTWGVPDEFTFKYAKLLLERAEKPTFIYIMTTTNHTPYQVPDDYKLKPLKVSKRLDEIVTSNIDDISEMLGSFQYANDKLGEFISAIKASSLSEKTLIAASGDHRVRSILTNRPDEVALSNLVPFYLYVPSNILGHSEYKYESNRIGSHRDIMPTLYHFSLSGSRYVSLGGENLLSPTGVTNRGYNNIRTLTEQGAYINSQPEKIYPWHDESLFTEAHPIDNADVAWTEEYRKLQNYYLRSQVVQ